GAVLLAGAIAGGAVGAQGDTPPDTTTTAATGTDTSATDTTSTQTTPTTTTAPTTTAPTTTAPTTTTVPTPAMPPINYGVADDTGKYADDGGAWFDTMLKGANLTEERWTLSFDPSNPTVIDELPFLLRAGCYDRIHRVDPAARVIGFGLSPRSNGPSQTPPLDFIAAVGAAYRASGRTTPIMDQMSIHPYPNPNRPTDGPDVGYANPAAYGVPNLGRVKQSLYNAFHGTGQPTTRNGLTFRIDELGWQTRTTLYPQYYNPENAAVAPLFAEGRAACTAGVTNWLPLRVPAKVKATKAKGQVKPRKGSKTPKRQS